MGNNILMPEMGNLDLFLEEPNPISFFCQLQWGCQRALQFAEYGNIHVSDSQMYLCLHKKLLTWGTGQSRTTDTGHF